MFNIYTCLSEEFLRPGVEPDGLLEEVARVLRAAHLLDLVLGGGDPERGVRHVHLQHPPEGPPDHVVPFLPRNRVHDLLRRGMSGKSRGVQGGAKGVAKLRQGSGA